MRARIDWLPLTLPVFMGLIEGSVDSDGFSRGEVGRVIAG
jgi:hypothetical protein